jgi:hypothetical protein
LKIGNKVKHEKQREHVSVHAAFSGAPLFIREEENAYTG